ncbi:hypothetical protein ACFFK0_07130 [Paenibacillus chartarius]|uniref:Methyl-accepting chemotaxis protein n=1 Tax=Paenibacillus chartarius TaxID=747481 RepID=A0ABV6DHZ0_9BACL
MNYISMNEAADNAAGMSISDKMREELESKGQGNSLVQSAEESLNQSKELLKRLSDQYQRTIVQAQDQNQ